jgi:prepilin-type N-terminal cleavage/methylation domain-containing protein
MRNNHKIGNQNGFTIIELMIATAVLSTILLLVTTILISIGSLYEKGVNQTLVSDDARTIADDVTQSLQFNDTPPVQVNGGASTFAYCINTTRYTYILDNTIDTNSYQHILWRDTLPANTACSTVNLQLTTPSSNGTELISPGSMLTYFCIDGVTASDNPEPVCPVGGSSLPGNSPFVVSVGVAHGLTTDLNLAGLSSTCKGRIGEQFCATSSLTTTVAQRIL